MTYITRTSASDLRKLAEAINEARKYYSLSTGYYVQYAYGQPRLEKLDGPGAVNISPRLPPGELRQWMSAYLAGMNAATKDAVGH